MRLWIALLLPLLTSTAMAAPPNIVVVLADDFGWGDVSCYGGKYSTPQLDRMAQQGTRFTQAYVAAPICSPSRAGLLTGQFPARWRITSYLQTRKGNRECEQADFLSPEAPSLPRVLQQAGYRTAHVGKWHLGGGRDVDHAPKFAAYGYDVGLGTWESPEPHPEITATDWIWSTKDPVARWDRTQWMVDQTLTFLKADPTRPAFVNLWLDDTHTPWVPSAETLAGDRPKAPNGERNFVAVLKEMDRQIGRLLDELQTQQLDTLVLFLGDNGPLPTFGQERTAGLRGCKLSLYEGGIRVPCIAWRPGHVPAARVDDATVFTALDFLPTLAAVAGAPLPAGSNLDGEDLTAALQGTAVTRTQPLFWEYGRNPKSFAYPQDAHQRSPSLALRDGPWKLIMNPDGSEAQLYHVVDDPKETNNQAAAESERLANLRTQLVDWWNSVPHGTPPE